MHIYAFGSICRGELSLESDIDLLAIVDTHDERFDPDKFSIYSYKRISELWGEGNPFAWHLYLEAKLLFASDDKDFLKDAGPPSVYNGYLKDCEKFFALFSESKMALENNGGTDIFELSTIFLSVRNFASCYSLGVREKANFSRHSALRLGDESVPIQSGVFMIFEKARMLSTRAQGKTLTEDEITNARDAVGALHIWMQGLMQKAQDNE